MPKETIDYEVRLEYQNTKQGLQQIATVTKKVNTGFQTTNVTMKKVNGQMKSVTRTVRTNTAALKRHNAQMLGATKKTGFFNTEMGKSIASLAGMAIGLGTAMRGFQFLKDYAGQGIEKMREFSQSMHEVSTILASTNDNFAEMETGVTALSKRFGKGVTDLSKGLYDLLSAAVAPKDAMFMLHTASKAAVAGISTVSTSVDALTSVMNSYGKTAEQMVHVSDVMFAAVIRGKFTYDKLANSMGYLTPIAAQVGIAFEELMAAIATTTRHGQHIDMVARGLALSIQNIIKPTEQAKESAMEYSVNLSLAALRAKGLIGFLQELNDATDGNSAAISRMIPNMRSYRIMMVLAGEGTDAAVDDLGRMEASLNKADEAFEKVAGSAKFAKDVMVQFNEEVQRDLGGVFHQLDLGIDKVKMFSGAWVKQISGGMFQIGDNMENIMGKSIDEMSNSESLKAYGLALLNIISLGFGEAGRQQSEINALIDEQLDTFKEAWNKKITGMEDEFQGIDVSKTIFQQMMEGQEVNFSEMEQINDKYLNLLQVYNIKGEELAQAMVDNLQGELSDLDLAEIKQDFQTLTNVVMDTREEWARWESAIDDAEQAVENHSDTIDILVAEMTDLKDSIGEVGDLYDGTLGKEFQVAEEEKRMADISHYLSLAKEEESYQVELAAQNFEWYSEELGNAITTVREYEKETKDATKTQDAFNVALARNAIAMKRIQLLGMMRRRGNTRAEQRMLKQLSIERTEIQIDQAEKELAIMQKGNEDVLSEEEMAYEKAAKIIDQFTRYNEHQLWVLKDARNQDVKDLKKQIEFKESTYMDLKNEVNIAYNDMNNAMNVHLKLVKEKFGEESIEVKNLTKDYKNLKQAQIGNIKVTTGSEPTVKTGSTSIAQEKISPGSDITRGKKLFLDAVMPDVSRGLRSLNVPGFKRGTSYVPADGMYNLHRGEAVVTSNNVSNDGDTIVNVNVTGNTITKETLPNIAKEVGDAVNRNTIDKKTGRSKYRLR